jgi:hypothetical protein
LRKLEVLPGKVGYVDIAYFHDGAALTSSQAVESARLFPPLHSAALVSVLY